MKTALGIIATLIVIVLIAWVLLLMVASGNKFLAASAAMIALCLCYACRRGP